MVYKRTMGLANFTCLFGRNKVLLDMFNEIVYPAFFDSHPRTYGKNTFYLFNLLFADVGGDQASEPVIAGRFVRDLGLTRSHVLRADELVPDHNEMESATAARFVLVLSTHTLLYVPETPHAPPTSMFQTTMQHHLTNAWSKYIKAEVRRRKANQRSKLTSSDILRKLLNELPRPELRIIELPSSISAESFLGKFSKINRVEYTIHDTNHSTAFRPLLDKLRAEKNATESENLIIVESRPSNVKALSKQLSDVGRDGNVSTKIDGKGHHGEKINGSNENYRLTVPLEDIPDEMNWFVKAVYSKFKRLVANDEIFVQAASGDAADKLNLIAESCESIERS